MSIAVMIHQENLPQLEYIAQQLGYISDLVTDSDESISLNTESLTFVTNAIDILKGSYNNVPFTQEPLSWYFAQVAE